MPPLPTRITVPCPACHHVRQPTIAAVEVRMDRADSAGFAMWACEACGPVVTVLDAARLDVYRRVGCPTMCYTRPPELADPNRRGEALTGNDMLDWLIEVHDTATVADLLEDVAR